MDKLQRYNQRLLAVGGTVIAAGVAVLLLAALFLVGSEIYGDYRRAQVQDYSLNVQSSESERETLISKDISFSRPHLADTLKGIYIIPVEQVNLEKPEKAQYAGSDSKTESYRGGYAKLSYSGAYNNLLIYRELTGEKRFLFDEKIFISRFSSEIIQGKLYLFIAAAKSDSDENGKLNWDDLHDLYVYDFESDNLQLFAFSGYSFNDYYIAESEKEAFLRYHSDKNGDGTINHFREPLLLKQISLPDFRIFNFIEEEEIMHLKKMIN